ncbi:MBL fold metallo-hydrolase [Chloroflexota bacterium]
MEIKITTLSENTANYGYLAEWGLSILVEVDEATILVDTGLSFSAMHNAQLMGIDLATIDCIVLSHGHADHTGGLRDVLKIRREVKVVAHPDIWIPKYVRREGEPQEQHNGMPFTREELESHGARFNLAREPVHIAEHILTTGEIPMLLDYEEIENNLFVKEAGMLRPDPLADDLALIIDTDFGLVVVLGCAHRGMISTLRHAQNLTGKELPPSKSSFRLVREGRRERSLIWLYRRSSWVRLGREGSRERSLIPFLSKPILVRLRREASGERSHIGLI